MSAVIAILLCYPLVELLAFMCVVFMVGWWPALAILILSIPIGWALVKRALSQLSESGYQDETLRSQFANTYPRTRISRAASIFASGILFMIPGFVTDLVAVALLVPGIRKPLGRLAESLLSSRGWLRQQQGPTPFDATIVTSSVIKRTDSTY